jgi:BirA family biotin operon repressor/biotin-[acetyl-CoA-carboxylase] ligase
LTTDAQILAALRASENRVSGADLAQRLGLSRAAVWARIEELRNLGYEIAASPHTGYQLLASPDLLHADDLVARLGTTRVVGRDIHVFHETGSTSDVVERFARDGAGEGVVVFAEAQTRGRGRLGRKWHSPAGKGLWFSVLLRPKLRPSAATQLTIAAATAVLRALRAHTGIRASIKWPNDILARGRKLVGILTEMNAEPDAVRHLIVGIGVDVNLGAAEIPADLRKVATSVKIETGEAWNRAELAALILRELDADYARVVEGKFAALADEWEAHCSTIGENVTVQVGDRRIQGRAEALDNDGALLIRTQHGRLERILGGDVTLER